jgi:VWFA-related protein
MATKDYSRLLLKGMAAGSLLLGVSHLCTAAEAKSSASVGEVIVTVQSHNDSTSRGLQSDDVTVYQGRSKRRVIGFERLSGEQAAMQLFIYLDDSIGTQALRTLLPDVRNFFETLPANTQVAVGSLHDGELQLRQAFTTDHRMAAEALKAPSAQSESSDSSYSALLYLAKRWPSEEPVGRRAVLMLTDGSDRDYGASADNDPYVEAAIRNSQIAGIAVYSVYLRGAGVYMPSDWAMNPGQSNLLALSNATGGHFYCEGLNEPVSLTPYFNDLEQRLANQYRITFEPRSDAGAQAVMVQTEMAGLKIIAPTRVYPRQHTLAAAVSDTTSFPEQQLAQHGQ